MATVSEVVESSLLKVPFDSLKRAAKERKAIVDEVTEATNTAIQQAEVAAKSCDGSSSSLQSQVQHLEALLQRLQGFKRKLADVSEVEREDAARCKARVEHLRDLGDPKEKGMVAWNKARLDRILVDHLHRSGYHESAFTLTKQCGLDKLVDTNIFKEAKQVADALQRRDCAPALAWCAENRGKLKKLKSKLEFKLRVQEFIELERRGGRMEAIQYARQYLAPWAGSHMQELQRAFATLAFGPATTCAPYAALFADSAWGELAAAFHGDLYRLYGLTPESLLIVHLQAGLSALKTPASYKEGCNKEDPLHLPEFRALAEGLPYAKHVHSKLVCPVTRQIMDESNPPMVLPNGHVYSQRAVEIITAQNGGRMVCPKTGSTYTQDELRRAFIV